MSSAPPRPPGAPDWAELAEDWLAAKRVGRRSDDPGNADRARRSDLVRWADAINTVQGRRLEHDQRSLAGWSSVLTELGDDAVLLRALDLLSGQLAASSTARALSTLRGFCRFLVRRGALVTDPTASDELIVRHGRSSEVRGLTLTDITSLEAAARLPLVGRERTRWAARDAAIAAHSRPMPVRDPMNIDFISIPPVPRTGNLRSHARDDSAAARMCSHSVVVTSQAQLAGRGAPAQKHAIRAVRIMAGGALDVGHRHAGISIDPPVQGQVAASAPGRTAAR